MKGNQFWLATVFVAALAVAPMKAQEAGRAEGSAPAEHKTLQAEHGAPDAEHKTGEAHESPYLIYWKWGNFALLVLVLGYLVRKQGLPLLQARGESIRKGIADATAMREQAEARAADIEKRLGNLEGELASLRQSAQGEMSAEAERIRQETMRELAKVQARAEQEIVSLAKAARQELKVYSARLALELAEGRIRERMTPATQDQLLQGFVADLRHNERAVAQEAR